MQKKSETVSEIIKTAKLKPVRNISEGAALRDMTRGNRIIGSPATAWHRGHQAGIHDAYLTLKKAYPEAAEELRKAFGMTEDGSYIL
jgi:hypothetical protein